LSGQLEQLLPGQRCGRLPQRRAQLQQWPDFVGTFALDLIGQPATKFGFVS